MLSQIRKINSNDIKRVRYICGALDNNLELSSTLFCDYYITKEPDSCFVAVDEFNNPCGCIMICKNFDSYQNEFAEYLLKIKSISLKAYKTYLKLNKQVQDINVDYPAHLVISILPAFQNKGLGKQLFEEAKKVLKQFNISGINVILDKENPGVISFFERMGFEKHQKISSSKYIYICNI